MKRGRKIGFSTGIYLQAIAGGILNAIKGIKGGILGLKGGIISTKESVDPKSRDSKR